MAVFLVFLLLAVHFAVVRATPPRERGILGGPVAEGAFVDSLAQPAAVVSPLLNTAEPSNEEVFSATGILEDDFWQASLVGSGQPANPASNFGAGFVNYKVKSGDTLSGISSEFGVSLDTVMGANPKLESRSLSVGQEIVVPTVSGAMYQVKEGDTLESIASAYAVGADQISEFNRSANPAALSPGTTLIIPGVKPQRHTVASDSNLPDLKGYFIKPTQGFNWGVIHPYNAVDIADSCGTPVVAAAEGLVIPDKNFGDGSDAWSDGYGHFVLLEHPNETKTRYAHLGKILVTVGQYLKQGQEVGLMGNTGNTHGPTGCHLHFEVYGARNPFAK